MKRGLRTGYTTGACAAAAAKAAALALALGRCVEEVELLLPTGVKAHFRIHRRFLGRDEAFCSVIKDAGDDPDVTNGAEICARVKRKEEPGISIEGGEGVGKVTKPGLEVPVGEAAINPVPRKMIARAVEEVLGHGVGARVEISVPRGEELAHKTLNPRLGIVGGISILGTTGIVIPYSKEACTASISLGLNVALACGCREVILTTGRRSEKFAQRRLKLPEECFIQMGDFVGYALKECARKGFRKAVIWGMIGKLSKLARGVFYTHSSASEVDLNFLAEVAKGCGVRDVGRLREAVTAHHFLKLLGDEREEVCSRICLLAAERAWEYAGGFLKIEVVMSDNEGNILGWASR